MKLREFDQADWQAYSGAETENPRIAEGDDGTVLIQDGTAVQVFTHDDEGEMTGFWSGAAETEVDAREWAAELCGKIERMGARAACKASPGLRTTVDRIAEDELAAAIQATNNGYLFAPTGQQVDTARSNPSRFRMIRYDVAPMAFRIWLRGTESKAS